MAEPFRWSWFEVPVVIQKSIVTSMYFKWEFDFISELGDFFISGGDSFCSSCAINHFDAFQFKLAFSVAEFETSFSEALQNGL